MKNCDKNTEGARNTNFSSCVYNQKCCVKLCISRTEVRATPTNPMRQQAQNALEKQGIYAF
jgi:hypothetical protein